MPKAERSRRVGDLSVNLFTGSSIGVEILQNLSSEAMLAYIIILAYIISVPDELRS